MATSNPACGQVDGDGLADAAAGPGDEGHAPVGHPVME